MSIYVSDNFESATTGAIPSGWTNIVGNWQVTTLNPVSGTKTLQPVSDADGDQVLRTGSTASADMQIEHTQKCLSSTAFGISGHILRSDSTASNCYVLIVNSSTATATGCSLMFFKKTGGGSFQQVGTAQDVVYGFTFAPGDVINVRTKAAGNTFTMTIGRNGVYSNASASWTDSTITTAGYPGIYYSRWQVPTSMDDYTVDNLAAPAGTNGLTNGTGNILFSPYNWDVGASNAKTINDGAYFKTIFGGTAVTLTFDTSGTSAPVPKCVYRIDGFGPWQAADLSSVMTLTVPPETSGYGSHFLEFHIRSTSESVSRWSPQNTMVSLTGIIIDTGKTLAKPLALPLNGLILGDSITAGVNTVSNVGDSTVRGSAQQGYAFQIGQILGAEVGIVGFGGQGWVTTGGGSVPVIGTTYNAIYSGVPRVWTPVPDFIVINQGTNDGANNTVTAVTSMLNGLAALVPASTKIFVLRPFNGSQASNIQSGIAATTTPSRFTYIDTTGFYTSANSSDTIHPYGWEHITHIAPSVANAIRPYIQPLKGTRVARTVTLTLKDRTGAARANLSGLKWSFFDQTTAGGLAVAADSGTTGTTNASGVLTLTVFTTLASGGTGWLTLSDSSGTAGVASNAFSAPVTVS